jgi:pimeloyl-ACP methyl ester carboxylesterase
MRFFILHGLASRPADWSAVRRLLPGAGFHIPDIDYLCPAVASLPHLAESALASAPPAFASPDTVLVGNSLGGLLALILGRRFSRLVLLSSHLGLESGFLGRGRKSFERELARVFRDPGNLPPELVADYRALWRSFIHDRGNLRRLARLKTLVQAFDPHPLYQALAPRISLVSGLDDALTPVAALAELSRSHPPMTLTVIKDCGHAVPYEQPRPLADILARIAQGGKAGGSAPGTPARRE